MAIYVPKYATGSMFGNTSSQGVWEFQCFDPNGKRKWLVPMFNLVTNEGLEEAMNNGLVAAATWYVFLANTGVTPANADTMATHAGWTENVTYSEATREVFVFGGITGTTTKSVDNSGTPAEFSITGSVTLGGGGLVKDGTKGGSTGELYSVGAFTGGDKAAANLDTVQVTGTFTFKDTAT